MVIETELQPFFNWLPAALGDWLRVVGWLAVAALVFTFVVAAVRNGPRRGLSIVLANLAAGLGDLVRISPRRVLALAWLAVKEAIHRRALVAFALFIIVLLFAGWYLDEATDDPARLYLSFVLTTTSYLVLLLALFVSVFSLPADINNRTIYTVVTKPVRPSELVLGRLLGFSTVGTVLLAITGVISYIFVERGLNHSHAVLASRVKSESAEGSTGERQGRTELAKNHRHSFTIDAQGRGATDVVQGHWHAVSVSNRGGEVAYEVGSPQGLLGARVPIYGKLRFKNRSGADAEKGDNVGEEWTYRSYIEGGTLAAAIWRFDGLRPEMFAEGLPIELTIRIFRTHKGEFTPDGEIKPIQGSLILRNPRTGRASAEQPFPAKEFTTDVQVIPRELLDAQGNAIELFRDLAPNGTLEVQLQCVPPGQYFGMAQPDVYIRARDASFTLNFVKGYVGMWLQMLLLTAGGVMFSTFLNGPVAMLATLAAMVAGFFVPFMRELATGTFLGGGPAESLVRLVTRKNLTTEIDPGPGKVVMQWTDELFRRVLANVVAVLPDFAVLSDVDYVAHGFDIPFDLLAQHVVRACAYLVPLFIAAYLLFRTREVAR